MGVDEHFENVKSMKRLEIMGRLIGDVTYLFEGISNNREVYKQCGRYGKLFKRRAVKELYRVSKRGFRIIKQKIPVYIELPKLQEEGNGGYSEVRIDDAPDKPKEIIYENTLPLEENPRLTNGEEDK